MWLDEINPYIRRAQKAKMGYPIIMSERVLLDYAITYIEKGSCEIGIDGQWRVCKKGDILLLPPDVPHQIRHVENVKVSSSYISFDLKYDVYSESRVLNYRKRDELSKEVKMQISENIFIDKQIQFYNVEQLEGFEEIFYDIIDNFKDSPKGFEALYCKGRLCQLLAMLLGDRADNIVRKETASIKDVKRFIEQNYTNNITLEYLCTHFYLNKFTLMRRFKEMYGTGVIKYVNMLKLERAKELLKKDEMTISEISTYLGYSTVFAFSKFFKMHTMVSPKDYRESQSVK